MNQDEYTQLNNMLTESLEPETEIESTKDKAESTTMDDDEDEGKLKKLILYHRQIRGTRGCLLYLLEGILRQRTN